MKALKGGCFCGAVRYEILGPPAASMVCHCRSCRRLTAAPMVGWITVETGQFRYVEGLPRTLRSSRRVLRHFCGECGTHLTYANDRDRGVVDVTTCSLDKPDLAPPTHHSWVSHGVRWVRLADRLPRFRKARTT